MEFVYDGSLYEAAEHLMDEVCRGVNDLASTIAGLSKPEDLDVNLGEIAEELRSIRHVMAEGLKKVSSTGQDLMKLDEGFNAGYMASKYGRNTSLMENPQEGITYTESNFNNDNKYYFMYYEKAMEKMLESDKYTDEQKEKIREAKEKVHEYYEYYSNLIKLKEQENHLYMLENDKDYANKYIKENFGEEIAALKKSQGSQYMSPEAAIKTREINKIQEAINETKKECGIEIEKNWWEKFTSAVSNIKDSALKTGAAWGKAFNSGNLSDYGDALKQTGCTFVVTASSAASGAAKLGELVRDGLTFVGGSALSGVAWLFDHDTGKDLMDGTLDWIRKDLVGEANKYIYENTSIGKWINENSNLKYDSEGAQMIRKVTEFATKIGVATAATIATGGAAAPAAIGIGALYGTGNNVEKYAQSVDRENGESYDYKRAFLKAFAGAGTGAAEFYGYGQMGAGMLGVNISPKASTSFAKNFLTTETLTDTASVVIDHGVNVALGDENWQDALIYGGGELALALGMSAIGAKQATKSARAAEAAEDAAKAAKQLDKSIEALENIDGVHRIDFDNPIEYNKYLDSLTPEQRTKFMTEYYNNGSEFTTTRYTDYYKKNIVPEISDEKFYKYSEAYLNPQYYDIKKKEFIWPPGEGSRQYSHLSDQDMLNITQNKGIDGLKELGATEVSFDELNKQGGISRATAKSDISQDIYGEYFGGYSTIGHNDVPHRVLGPDTTEAIANKTGSLYKMNVDSPINSITIMDADGFPTGLKVGPGTDYDVRILKTETADWFGQTGGADQYVFYVTDKNGKILTKNAYNGTQQSYKLTRSQLEEMGIITDFIK